MKITEAGRKHLGGLLSQLSDQQIDDLFRSARFDQPTGMLGLHADADPRMGARVQGQGRSRSPTVRRVRSRRAAAIPRRPSRRCRLIAWKKKPSSVISASMK